MHSIVNTVPCSLVIDIFMMYSTFNAWYIFLEARRKIFMILCPFNAEQELIPVRNFYIRFLLGILDRNLYTGWMQILCRYFVQGILERLGCLVARLITKHLLISRSPPTKVEMATRISDGWSDHFLPARMDSSISEVLRKHKYCKLQVDCRFLCVLRLISIFNFLLWSKL